MPVPIRTAQLEDYEAVDALWREGDRYHARLVPEVFLPEGAGPARPRAFFEEALQSPESTILVAERDQKPVGFALVQLRHTPDLSAMVSRMYGLVDSLVVTEDCRGQGIGRALMKAAEQWVRERGGGQMQLGVWTANERAKAFYASLGYHTISERMEKDLT